MGHKLVQGIMTTLPGNFQIPIASKCNLHCRNCGFMDYYMSGKGTIEKTMNVDDVIYLDKKITDLNLKLNEIELFGGEPTINPKFSEIVDYLQTRRGKFFDKMRCFTNGLNLTKSVVESLKVMDRIDISVYPIDDTSIYDFEKTWESSKISKILDVCIHGREEFHYPIEEFDITKKTDIQTIYDACYQKDGCRVMVMDGIYRCGMIHHERTEIYPFDRDLLIDRFITNSNQPLEHCKNCGEATAIYLDSIGKSHLYKKKWKSNKLDVDTKNFKRGLKLMREYD